MLTLEQFRATGRDVPDISLYSGSAQSAEGRVYMDGTLSIERFNDGTGTKKWLLVIGNDEDVGSLSALEARLYDWGKDEYGTTFDTPPTASLPAY